MIFTKKMSSINFAEIRESALCITGYTAHSTGELKSWRNCPSPATGCVVYLEKFAGSRRGFSSCATVPGRPNGIGLEQGLSHAFPGGS